MEPFPTDLRVPLGWVDSLLRREVARLRQRYVLAADELRGRVVHDAQVDALLAEGHGPAPATADLDEAAVRAGARIDDWLRDSAAWTALARRFTLDGHAARLLLLALAPELKPRYGRVYAYLNDHAGHGWLTRDLALRLLGEAADPAAARTALAAAAPALASGLLLVHADGPVGWAQQGLLLDPAAAHVLQGLPPRLAPLGNGCRHLPGRGDGARWPPATAEALGRLASVLDGAERPAWLAFPGRPGSGRSAAVALLAWQLGVPPVRADADALTADPGTVARLTLYQRLTGAVALADTGALTDPDGRPRAEAMPLLERLLDAGSRVVWRCRSPDEVEALAAGRHRVLAVDFERWSVDERVLLWLEALSGHEGPPPGLDVRALASRFRLTPAQIGSAAARVRDTAAAEGRAAVAGDVFEAAREQSRTGIGRLAARVDTRATWQQLVLPDETTQALRGFVDAVRQREVVFEQWGLGRHGPGGRAILAMFSGPPGTGKTLGAEVVAAELELDLYRIELSAVVSKYIGETESNLQRVFEAARDMDAMLFFDECDALFGKRSEVKDAHDRYANTEIAYLLQAVEGHAADAGPVVLCTNRIGDLDAAFLRRIQHVVEFPFPKSPLLRRALFEAHLPPGLPRSADVDLGFLADNFELAGGEIRNVVLDAAVRAAASREPLAMYHLVQALGRQLRKRGTAPSPTDFKQHFGLLTRQRPGHVA